MLKRTVSIFLVFAFALLVTACGKNTADSTDSSANGSSSSQNESADTSEPQNIKDSDAKKAAVVYFSATGTTERVARLIAAEADADILEIIPKVEYSSDDLNYSDDNCRANLEMNDKNSRPEISSDLSSVSDYDTIYLGYPIWWGTAPRIIQTFLEGHSLEGKNIYLFCTSGSSGIEQSVRNLQDSYANLNIVSGKRLNGAMENDIQARLSELNGSK